MIACSYATFLLFRDVIGPIALAYLCTPFIKGVKHLKPRSGWPKFLKRKKEESRRRPQRRHSDSNWEEMKRLHFPQPQILYSPGAAPQITFRSPPQLTYPQPSQSGHWKKGEETVTFQGLEEDDEGGFLQRNNTGIFTKRARPKSHMRELD